MNIEDYKQEYNTLMEQYHEGKINEAPIEDFFMGLLENFASEIKVVIYYDSDELDPEETDIFEDVNILVSEVDYNNQEEVNLMFDFFKTMDENPRHPFIEKIISDVEYHAGHYRKDDWYDSGEYIEEETKIYIY